MPCGVILHGTYTSEVRNMKNTEIIYKASGSPEVPNIESVEEVNCLICGKKIKEGVLSKNVLSGNFTNWGDCFDRTSDHICKECAFCMKERTIRVNSFISDSEKLYLLKKNDIEEYLFNLEKYVEGEFVIGLTQSFKKHNSFRCRVNTNPKCFYIREEDREYLFNILELEPVYKLLNEAYLQFSKEELLTGQYKFISIEQFGLEQFEKYETVFKKYRGSPQFDIMVYLMNSEKRNEYVQAKMKAEKEERARLKALEKEKKKLEKQKKKEPNKDIDIEEIKGQMSLF